MMKFLSEACFLIDVTLTVNKAVDYNKELYFVSSVLLIGNHVILTQYINCCDYVDSKEAWVNYCDI
jgi:hypothetical protein